MFGAIVIEKNEGAGTHEDPVRNVLFIYDRKTLEYLGQIDPMPEVKVM